MLRAAAVAPLQANLAGWQVRIAAANAKRMAGVFIGPMGPIRPIAPINRSKITKTQIPGIASENRTEDRVSEIRATEEPESESHEDDWGNYSNSHNTRKPML